MFRSLLFCTLLVLISFEQVVVGLVVELGNLNYKVC